MAEMENLSYVPLKQPIVFTLEGFDITRQQRYSLFPFLFIVYATLLLGNITVFLVIALDAKLHKPMYLMMCNLAAGDLIGGTVVMAPMMSHFLTEDRSISYVAAMVLAFGLHTYSLAVSTILAAMAYDRYVAICQPLHYHTIMTTGRLVSLCFLAWFSVVFLIIIRMMVSMETPLCGTLIKHVFCSFPSILRLVCVPAPINNILSLCSNWIVKTFTFLVMAFSYTMIFKACVVKQEKNTRSKAIQTCSSHLSLYLILELTVVISMVSYRLQGLSPNIKKFYTILVIVPPTVDPIIYGIAMKDIRTNIVKFFKHAVLLKLAKPACITPLPK